MVNSSSQLTPRRRLAQQAREQFAKELETLISGLVRVIHQRLTAPPQASGSTQSDLHLLMDTTARFAAEYRPWAEAVYQGWHAALQNSGSPDAGNSQAAALGLLDDEVVEKEILVSRLSLAVQDKAHWDINDLRLRIQMLEGSRELAGCALMLAGMLLSQYKNLRY